MRENPLCIVFREYLVEIVVSGKKLFIVIGKLAILCRVVYKMLAYTQNLVYGIGGTLPNPIFRLSLFKVKVLEGTSFRYE